MKKRYKSEKVKGNTKAMALAICVVLLVAMSGISAATHNDKSCLTSPTTQDNIDFTIGDTIKDVQQTIQLDPKIKAPSGGAVLWDLTHGVYLGYGPSDGFSSLVSLLSSKGYTVNTIDTGILSIDLSQYDVLVICLGSAWYSAYTTEEVSAIESFVRNGGGLLVMGDNTACPNENINPVAQAFGTTCGVSYLSPLDLYVTDLAPHPIFDGVSEIFMRAAGEIDSVSPSEEVAWTDGLGTIAVATFGSGRVVTLGDINLWDNTYITYADNQLLAENIFDWLSAPTTPTTPKVLIYTDKTNYTTGDTMHVGLDVTNPGDAMPVIFVIWLERPEGGIYVLTFTSVTLPAGLDYSNPDFAVFTLPSIPSGTYTWHAALIEPSGPVEVISHDTAEWEFVSAVAGAPTEDVSGMLEQTAVVIDFSE